MEQGRWVSSEIYASLPSLAEARQLRDTKTARRLNARRRTGDTRYAG